MPSYHTPLFLCLAGEGFYSFLLVGEGWMGGKRGIGDSPAFNPTLALPRLRGGTHWSPHSKVCAEHYWAWESRPREISPMPGRLRIVVIGLMALIVFCVAPVTAADKIKIGYIATMSGPAASLGQDILDGFNPTATFIFDLRSASPYASPAYPIYSKETA